MRFACAQRRSEREAVDGGGGAVLGSRALMRGSVNVECGQSIEERATRVAPIDTRMLGFHAVGRCSARGAEALRAI